MESNDLDLASTPDGTHPAVPGVADAELGASLRRSLDALEQSARLLAQAAGGLPAPPHEVQLFYRTEQGYAMRPFMDDLLAADRPDLLAAAIQAGFPMEAPIGFAHGSVLCSAALIGSPRCIQLLASLGADLEFPNDHGLSPLELACGEAGELWLHVECARALALAGASTSFAARLAARPPLDIGSLPKKLLPLGRHALSNLGHQWPDVLAWGDRLEAPPGGAVPAAAERLRALRDALGHSDEEFLGLPLGECLSLAGLPADIEAAWISQEEQSALSSSCPPIAAAPPPAKRRAL